MRHTCGLILIDKNFKTVAGLPFGGIFKHNGLSFPKGIANENEDYFDAAIRETKEEIGLDINNFDCCISSIEPIDYRKDKILHMFLVNIKNIDLEIYPFECTSFINDTNNPEIMEFYVLSIKKMVHLLHPKQGKILERIL